MNCILTATYISNLETIINFLMFIETTAFVIETSNLIHICICVMFIRMDVTVVL